MSLYSRGKARKSLIDTVLFRAVSQVATVGSFAVLVRGMTRESFGVYSLLYSFIPLMSLFASLGLEQILRRYQPDYLRAGNTVAALWLTRIVMAARLGTNLLFVGILLLAWNYVAPLVHLGAYRIEFSIFCLLILLYFQTQILQLSLASHMLHRFSVGSIAIISIGKLVGYMALTVLGLLTLRSAIWVDIGSYAAAYGFMTLVYRRYCTPPVGALAYTPQPAEHRRMIRYGLFNNFNDAGSFMMDSRADNFFIAGFIDAVSVGIYSFYTRLNEMISNLQPIRLFENVIQPMFFSVPQSDADRRVPEYFTLLLNMNFVLQWPVLAFSVAYHAQLVQVVFGGKFIEHSWLLPVVIGFATFNLVATPVTLVAQYEERAGTILAGKIFAVYNILAMIALLPYLGLYGAAVASGSAQICKNLFIWWRVRKRAVWLNSSAALLSSIAIWGVVVGAAWIFKRTVPVLPIVHLTIGAILCSIGVLVHLRSPAIAASDRQILGLLFHGKEANFLKRFGLLTAPVSGRAA